MVAPHAGAWIETLLTVSSHAVVGVAPHAGAWIETSQRVRRAIRMRSRPTRARGLKLHRMTLRTFDNIVAPHAGAWIETTTSRKFQRPRWSRPTRARGLKLGGHVVVRA